MKCMNGNNQISLNNWASPSIKELHATTHVGRYKAITEPATKPVQPTQFNYQTFTQTFFSSHFLTQKGTIIILSLFFFFFVAKCVLLCFVFFYPFLFFSFLFLNGGVLQMRHLPGLRQRWQLITSLLSRASSLHPLLYFFSVSDKQCDQI